ncbi:hypothetical protein N7495_005561 [Penicillium taxi]|uniref:uncharacterized protein n=1 Tax=Penicillium taxi TaxID=168475 RepID=UPI0025450702|nr:uncharacterized protein N7495_005561 [Penicillium taxi]KAJ5893870.1 hypothetical protein N7495_005561 [Penicillium taxi]
MQDLNTQADNGELTFHPRLITRSTFQKLLSCYPTTVERVHQHRIEQKLQPKKSKKKGASVQGLESVKTDFSKEEQSQIRDEVNRVLDLDEWRYEKMPAAILERRAANEEEEKMEDSELLTKDELVNIVEWKLAWVCGIPLKEVTLLIQVLWIRKHGKYRPALKGMVKKNTESLVSKCVEAAIAALPTTTEFPTASMDAILPLHGIGPATASLILSIATAAGEVKGQIPFYSDDLFYWVCMHQYPGMENEGSSEESAPLETSSKKAALKPNGELNVKYTLAEYQLLWLASLELNVHLNHPENKGSPELPVFSHVDAEKVAYVLRHLDVSGFYPEHESAQDQGESASDCKMEGSKRKAFDEEEKPLKRSKRKREGLRNN